MAATIYNRNPNSQSLLENPFVKPLAVSVFMGVFLVLMALGLYETLLTRSSPLPLALILLIFAVMFIVGMVFYEKQGLGTFGALIGGIIAGFGLSFVFVCLVGGVQFAVAGGISSIGWNQVISAVAVSMIASVILFKALYHKLQNHSY